MSARCWDRRRAAKRARRSRTLICDGWYVVGSSVELCELIARILKPTDMALVRGQLEESLRAALGIRSVTPTDPPPQRGPRPIAIWADEPYRLSNLDLFEVSVVPKPTKPHAIITSITEVSDA